MTTLKWDIEKCLEQCSPVPLSNHPYISKVKPKRLKSITFIEIRKAYNHIANIIALHGEKYLPLFERLHTELIECREKNHLLNIAKRISQTNLSTGGIAKD